MVNNADRFDFEQQILQCWRVTDDIRDLSEGVLESELSTDQINNVLVGLHQMYELKFNKLWDLFEDVVMGLVRENKMLNEECSAMRAQLTEAEGGYGAGRSSTNQGAGHPTLFGKLDLQGNDTNAIKGKKK